MLQSPKTQWYIDIQVEREGCQDIGDHKAVTSGAVIWASEREGVQDAVDGIHETGRMIRKG